jgi:signal transduction histidine kinase
LLEICERLVWNNEQAMEYERSATPAVDMLRQRVHPGDVAIVRELGERERLEQRLRQAEKMEAVGRRVCGITHDFNNVLAGVLAYGEMLLAQTPAGSELRRYAQNVLIAASRGRELVEQILTYSRTQRGGRVPVDFATVVAETLELIRGSLPAGIRLEASAPKAPLVLIGDATQLHQVAMNLCSNAIHAMSTGGTLRVALEAAELPARALSHGTLEPGRYVRLIVADSGSGMDETTLARIFEPFFTTKEVGKGTGLGLSLVYAIIIDSGGAIDVQSAPAGQHLHDLPAVGTGAG